MTRRLAERIHREDGTVTAFVVVFTAALILFAGLVIDGGLTLAARVQAINEAAPGTYVGSAGCATIALIGLWLMTRRTA